MRKTKEQKTRDMITSHNIMSTRFAEFKEAGVGEYANWCQRVEQAVELKAHGITVEQWREWRGQNWDVTKYPLLTPANIASYIARGMKPEDAKRELNTYHPRPTQTR